MDELAENSGELINKVIQSLIEIGSDDNNTKEERAKIRASYDEEMRLLKIDFPISSRCTNPAWKEEIKKIAEKYEKILIDKNLMDYSEII
jgi:hypothetical protein